MDEEKKGSVQHHRADFSRFEIFRMGRCPTDKSSAICHEYGLVPSRMECKLFRIEYNFFTICKK